MKTLHNININPGLLWDYRFSEHEYQTEEFFVWYLGRLLERGTFAEVQQIPRDVIAQYLNKLALSSRVRNFWQWYLNVQ